MAWIKSYQELARHPKTRRACRLLQIPTPQLIGHLHLMWWWVLDFAEDGDISAFSHDDIADGAQWEGDSCAFVQAMIDVGFLDQSEECALCVHDWFEYAGNLLSKRELTRERVKRFRERRAAYNKEAGNAPVTRYKEAGNAPVTHPKSKRREEKSESKRESVRERETADAVNTHTPLQAVPKPRAGRTPREETGPPDNIAVTDKLREFHAAHSPTLDLNREITKFLTKARAKGWRYKDWSQAFENWLVNEEQYTAERYQRNGTAPPTAANPNAPPEGYSWEKYPDGRWVPLGGDPFTGILPYGANTVAEVTERHRERSRQMRDRGKAAQVGVSH